MSSRYGDENEAEGGDMVEQLAHEMYNFILEQEGRVSLSIKSPSRVLAVNPLHGLSLPSRLEREKIE